MTDPEGFRILEFTQDGNFVQYWGDLGSGATGFDLPTGIAADPLGGIWVTDSGNHQLLHFNPPGN